MQFMNSEVLSEYLTQKGLSVVPTTIGCLLTYISPIAGAIDAATEPQQLIDWIGNIPGFDEIVTTEEGNTQKFSDGLLATLGSVDDIETCKWVIIAFLIDTLLADRPETAIVHTPTPWDIITATPGPVQSLIGVQPGEWHYKNVFDSTKPGTVERDIVLQPVTVTIDGKEFTHNLTHYIADGIAIIAAILGKDFQMSMYGYNYQSFDGVIEQYRTPEIYPDIEVTFSNEMTLYLPEQCFEGLATGAYWADVELSQIVTSVKYGDEVYQI